MQLVLRWELTVAPNGIIEVPQPRRRGVAEVVETGLAHAVRALRCTMPAVRWFKPVPGGPYDPAADGSKGVTTLGLYVYGSSTLWLNRGNLSLSRLAITVAHEAVHHWQAETQWRTCEDGESEKRELQARRRAPLLTPAGMRLRRIHSRYPSQADPDRERRLRRMAADRGLRLMRSSSRGTRPTSGTYGIADLARAWVASSGSDGFGMDLDGVEAWLERDAAACSLVGPSPGVIPTR